MTAQARECEGCGLTFIPPFKPGWTWSTNIPVWKGKCPDCTDERRRVVQVVEVVA